MTDRLQATKKIIIHTWGVCGSKHKRARPEWLKRTRKVAHVGLREMARRLGVSAPYLHGLEGGKNLCPDYVRRTYEDLL